jgi:hypothetical protein
MNILEKLKKIKKLIPYINIISKIPKKKLSGLNLEEQLKEIK